MTAALERFKQLLTELTPEDRLSNQQWLSRQAHYRAADIQARERARLLAGIYIYRARNAPYII
jgi:hypothetical protein